MVAEPRVEWYVEKDLQAGEHFRNAFGLGRVSGWHQV